MSSGTITALLKDASSLAALSVDALLRRITDAFPEGSARLSSSLSAEDQVLTHIIARSELPIRVFTLDTGRLFPKSYELLEATTRMGVSVEVFVPQAESVQQMVREHGVNLFRESRDLRKRCCEVRKVEPLERALNGCRAWITGMRQGQSVTREDLNVVELDTRRGILKVNPLARWSSKDVWRYIREHKVPYHPLHDRGFPSIGCAPCTRAVRPGEHERAGRWWWESADHKECGLHSHAALLDPTESEKFDHPPGQGFSRIPFGEVKTNSE